MFLKNLWQNMKIVVQCISWIYLSTILHLCEKAASFCNRPTLTHFARSKARDDKGEPSLELLPIETHSNSEYEDVLHLFNVPVLVKDPCHQDKLAYAVTSGELEGKVVFTTDKFTGKSSTLYVKRGLFKNPPVLTSMVFLDNGDLLTVINHELTVFDFDTFHHNKTKTGIGEKGKLDTVSVHLCCGLDIDWCHALSDVTLFYKSNSPITTFYYSTDRGRNFQSSLLSKDKQQYEILSSTVMGSDLVAVFLVRSQSKNQIMIIAHPLNQHRHFHLTRKGLDLYSEILHDLSSTAYNYTGMAQLYSGFSSFILWDHQNIYYRAQLTGNNSDLTLYHTVGSSILQPDEYIRHIDSNSVGEFIMTTSHNRLLYGREAITTEASFIPNVSEMIPNTSDVIATFDNVAGEALLVSPASLDEQVDNSLAMVYTKYIHIGSYLLKLDLPQCPYQQIQGEKLKSHHLLDIHDIIEFDTVIRTTSLMDFSILTEVTEGSSMTLTNTRLIMVSDDPGVVTIKMKTVGVLSHIAYQGHALSEHVYPQEITKESGVRLVSTSSSLTCLDPAQRVSHISFGCPAEKHIVANRDVWNCDELRHEYSYTLQASQYDPHYGKYGYHQASEPKQVDYDYQIYGCTNRTYYNEPFRFDLRLYKGSTYIGPMTGDFVVLEVNGVNKFSYDLTVENSGCRNPPQSWREMRLSTSNDTPPNQAWHRGNYRSCLLDYDHLPSDRNFTAGPSDPYEILSIDNGNYLTFDKNGIFMFEIIVVDHDYSFCDLRAHIAVEVFGVQPHVPVPFFLIMCVTVAGFLVIVIFIFCIIDYRRRSKIYKANEMDRIDGFDHMLVEYQEEQERIDELELNRKMSRSRRRASLGRNKPIQRDSNTKYSNG